MTKNQHSNQRKLPFPNALWKLTALFSLVFSSGLAQELKTIEGTVTASSDGMPIPGVNVLVKGTSNGTATDFDGNYSIEATLEDILVLYRL